MVTANDLPLWSSMARHYNTLRSLSRWMIGAGEKSFWMDNWAGEVVYGPYPVDATLTVAQGLNIITELWHLIPQQLHEPIRKVSIFPNYTDKLIFTLADNGIFSTKRFVDSRGQRGAARRWEKWVWQPRFPPNLSIFLWRLVRHALPVNSRIQSRYPLSFKMPLL